MVVDDRRQDRPLVAFPRRGQRAIAHRADRPRAHAGPDRRPRRRRRDRSLDAPPAINGVIAHKGMVARLASAGVLAGRGVMVHLNGATAIGEEPDTKHLLTGVETALRLGADGVSVQVNFRPDNDAHNLGVLGRVVDEAERYGLPVLAMVYPAGVVDDETVAMARHRHFLRIAFELGVDAVKTAPPQHLEDIPLLLDGVDDLTVLFSGGSLASDESLISLAKAVATAGAGGLCVGRNVFQRTEPDGILAQLRAGAGRVAPSLGAGRRGTVSCRTGSTATSSLPRLTRSRRRRWGRIGPWRSPSAPLASSSPSTPSRCPLDHGRPDGETHRGVRPRGRRPRRPRPAVPGVLPGRTGQRGAAADPPPVVPRLSRAGARRVPRAHARPARHGPLHAGRDPSTE